MQRRPKRAARVYGNVCQFIASDSSCVSLSISLAQSSTQVGADCRRRHCGRRHDERRIVEHVVILVYASDIRADVNITARFQIE